MVTKLQNSDLTLMQIQTIFLKYTIFVFFSHQGVLDIQILRCQGYAPYMFLYSFMVQ